MGQVGEAASADRGLGGPARSVRDEVIIPRHDGGGDGGAGGGAGGGGGGGGKGSWAESTGEETKLRQRCRRLYVFGRPLPLPQWGFVHLGGPTVWSHRWG